MEIAQQCIHILILLNSTDNIVNVHMFEKTKFSFTSWLCDVPVDVNEKSVFQYFEVLLKLSFFQIVRDLGS